MYQFTKVLLIHLLTLQASLNCMEILAEHMTANKTNSSSAQQPTFGFITFLSNALQSFDEAFTPKEIDAIATEAPSKYTAAISKIDELWDVIQTQAIQEASIPLSSLNDLSNVLIALDDSLAYQRVLNYTAEDPLEKYIALHWIFRSLLNTLTEKRINNPYVTTLIINFLAESKKKSWSILRCHETTLQYELFDDFEVIEKE